MQFIENYKNNRKNDFVACRMKRSSFTVTLRKEKRQLIINSKRSLDNEVVIDFKDLQIKEVVQLMRLLSHNDPDERMTAMKILTNKNISKLMVQSILNAEMISNLLLIIETESYPLIQTQSLKTLINIDQISDVKEEMALVNGNSRILNMLNSGNEDVVKYCLKFLRNSIINGDVLSDLLTNGQLLDYVKHVIQYKSHSSIIMEQISDFVSCIIHNYKGEYFHSLLECLWPIIVAFCISDEKCVQCDGLKTMIDILKSREYTIDLFLGKDISDIILRLIQSKHSSVKKCSLKLLFQVAIETKNPEIYFQYFINKGVLRLIKNLLQEYTSICLGILLEISQSFDQDIINNGFLTILSDLLRSDVDKEFRHDSIFILGNLELSKGNIEEILYLNNVTRFKEILEGDDIEIIIKTLYFIRKLTDSVRQMDDYITDFKETLTRNCFDMLERYSYHDNSKISAYSSDILEDLLYI